MSNYSVTDFDLEQLVAVLGDPTSLSEPEREYFWFKYDGFPGRSVLLKVSKYDRRASVIIDSEAGESLFAMESVDLVRVLEPERRTLEIISSEFKTRCFLALHGDGPIEVSVGDLDDHGY